MASRGPLACPNPLGTVPRPVKPRNRGGSTDLMDFYATSQALAHGQLHFLPYLGQHSGAGFVSNYQSSVPELLCPVLGHRTVTSTTTEDFKPFWFPDGQNLLPRHVHQPGSGYIQEFPPSCLSTQGMSPLQLQGPPKLSRKHGTHPVQPDVLQKTTIGSMEPSGFTKAMPRTARVLPTLPGQPLGVSVTTMDYQPSEHSQGHEPLPGLPVGSKRGSGFSRALLSSMDLGTPWLQTPRVTRASLPGQRVPRRMEPSGFTINNSRYIPTHPCPADPAPHWWDPTGMVKLLGGIQPLRPSGFSTNNNPTNLGGNTGGPR